MYATYLEIKEELGVAVLEGYDAAASPFVQWDHMLKRTYDFLSDEPERARFLSQLEESPYYEEAHARLIAAGDPLAEAARSEQFTDLIVDLPSQVIYTLSFGVAVRLIAAGIQLKNEELDTLVTATWRAVTRP